MASSVKRNFAYNVFYNLLQVAVPIITTPYLSRILGPQGVGTYSFTNAIASYFVLVAVLGMSTYGVRTTAMARKSKERLTQTFWDVYASQLVVGAVVMAAYVAYAFWFVDEARVLYLLWLPLVFSATIDISWFLFGLEDFGYTTARSLVVRIIGVVLIFTLVKEPADLNKYILVSALIALLNALALWPRALSNVDFARPRLSHMRKHFVANLGLFVPVIAISLYNSLDKIMLGVMCGAIEVGYYEYAGKLTSLSASVIGAMGTVMLPRISSVLSEGRRDEALSLVETSLWLMLAMAMAFSFGLAGIAPVFVPVFFGAEFLPCVVLMCVLASTIPLLSVSNVLGRQWLLPNQGDRHYTLSVCVGAGVDVCLNLVTIPLFGALGASISTIAAELAVVACQAVFVRGELPLMSYLLNALPFAVMGAVMLGIVRVVAMLGGSMRMSSLALLITQIATGALCYTAMALTFCIIRKDEHFNRVFGTRVRSLRKESGNG